MNPAMVLPDFLEAAKHFPVIDVRSPSEYRKGHVPGAVNIPLFSDEERARVGTVYKQQGRDAAVLLGLEIVGPRMAEMVRETARLSPQRKVLVHCWRGGMRSGSFAWLLNAAGFETSTLKRGYKAYRENIRKRFTTPYQLCIIGGETGSGKTDMLKAMVEAGEQIIDLEGIAHHKGSSFGALGQEEQQSVETFENELGECMKMLDPTRRVWVEDESKSIGRVFVPDEFWEQMKKAPVLRVQVPKQERVKRLVAEYGSFDKAELEAAILRIQKRLGGLALRQCLEALHAGDLALVADITLAYYDKAYNFNKEKNVRLVIEAQKDDPAQTAAQLIERANQEGEELWKIPTP
jgi:tRNA 2-selenouridine synthase